jgi:hypothetical protein
MEVLPASSRVAGVVLGTPLRDPIECGEPGLGSVRRGEEGHSQTVPISPLAVRIGDDLAKSPKIIIIELGIVLRSASPAASRKLNRDERLEELDDFGSIDLDIRPEIDDPGEPWLTLSMPAAGPSQWVGRRNGSCIAANESAGQSACALEESVFGGGAARLATPPMQVQFLLDLAALRIDPPPEATTTVGGPSTNVRFRRAIAGALSASTVRTRPLARSRSRARSPINVATGGANTAGQRVLAALVACRTA